MKRTSIFLSVCLGFILVANIASGRGFGGFRTSFAGADRFGSFSGSAGRSFSDGLGSSFSSFSGSDRLGGSYSGSRSTESISGWGGAAAGSTYDHSWTSAAGASLSTSGSRGIAEGRFGGVAAGGTRDTSLTTAGGKTYTADRQGAVASGPLGRTVGGASGTVDGRLGTSSWETAFSGNRYTGDMSHFASVYGANGAHSTAYWSSGYMNTRATSIRTGFGYYGSFHAAWYTTHPGAWLAAGWASGTAWLPASFIDISTFCGIPAIAPDYDYGTCVTFQQNNVYVNGQDMGTAQQYAQQATKIAVQGQTATAPPTAEWKALGVFALVQGDEKTSNNIFQLAVNKDGIIRGNYYDGLMDTTTEVYGSVDKTTELAAWTIGKKQDRVFEAGIYNLTLPQCTCLLHIGTQTTNQMMLVRMEQPKNGQ